VTGAARLVGGWRLRSWVSITDDGEEAHPMGDMPDGLLTYTADGTMVGIMGPNDRPRLSTDDVTGGTPEERAAAFATFIAYGGRFAVDGDAVIHTVETSLFPNWIGTEQRRRFAISEDGRTLTLTSPPIVLGGTRRIQRLTWSRIDERG
jgi:hypothetical protein